MINQRDRFTESEFDELCQYVCSQLIYSGSRQRDMEALYFGLYWQVSVLFGSRLSFSLPVGDSAAVSEEIPAELISRKEINYQSANSAKIEIIKALLENLLRDRSTNDFNVLQIVNRRIAEKLANNYDFVKTAEA